MSCIGVFVRYVYLFCLAVLLAEVLSDPMLVRLLPHCTGIHWMYDV